MESIKLIVLGSGKATNHFLRRCIELPYISVVGNIPDKAVDMADLEKLNSEVKDLGVSLLELNENNLANSDVIFSIEYRRIIPSHLFDHYLFVNCHGGILPKWRGFSANAWAIMNGENEIGFSIHRVREGLDAGEIYYVKHIPIRKDQVYGDLHSVMIEAIADESPKILLDIVKGKNAGKKQPPSGFAYCNRFTKSMGDISGFTNTSEYYVNLYRCMAKPLGSGVWFDYKGDAFSVGMIELGKDYGVIDYRGIPGKIVNILNEKLWVKTDDNVIILSNIERKGVKIQLSDYFTNGNRL